MIIRWEPKEEDESSIGTIEARSEVEGSKEEPTREVTTCTNSSTRSEQISYGDELDWGMCSEEVAGEINQYVKMRLQEIWKWREEKGWVNELGVVESEFHQIECGGWCIA